MADKSSNDIDGQNVAEVYKCDSLYQFFPKEKEILTQSPKNKQNIRYLYEGAVQLGYGEMELIFEIKGKIQILFQKKKPDLYNKLEGINDIEILRFFYASEDNISKTCENLKKYVLYLDKLDSELELPYTLIFNTGCLYTFGRDSSFRPIIVLNLLKIIETVKKYNLDTWASAVSIFTNYIIDEMLIPGQIENWVTFVDFQGIGFWEKGKAKDIIKAFKDVSLGNYVTRLYRNFMFNHLKKFSMVNIDQERELIKQVIVDKNVGKDNNDSPFKIINPDQVEKKYGGTHPDLEKNFWPPKMVQPENCQLPDENLKEKLLSGEEYYKMYQNNEFLPCQVICQGLIVKYKDSYVKKENEDPGLMNVVLTDEKIQTKKLSHFSKHSQTSQQSKTPSKIIVDAEPGYSISISDGTNKEKEASVNSIEINVIPPSSRNSKVINTLCEEAQDKEVNPHSEEAKDDQSNSELFGIPDLTDYNEDIDEGVTDVVYEYSNVRKLKDLDEINTPFNTPKKDLI